MTGGPPQVLCDAPEGGPGGATWSREGVILFASSRGQGSGSDLVRVSASGGTPAPVTTRARDRRERFYGWPWFLPDGRHFLYVTQTGTAAEPINTVYVGSLDSADRTELFTADSKAAYADGHLLFVRDGTLMAQPFDAARLRMTANAFPVAEEVGSTPTFARAAFSVSETGVLTYRTNTVSPVRQLAWFDRSGKEMARLGEPANLTNIEMSQDGKRVASVLRGPRAAAPLTSGSTTWNEAFRHG